MDTTTRSAPSAPAAGTRHWYPVQDVIGPLAGDAGTAALYVAGGALGAATATSTGRRLVPLVPSGERASFGTYFNAFPAAYWREHVGTCFVRLRLEVDGLAVVTVRRSDATGAVAIVDKRLADADTPTVLDVDIAGTAAGGIVWFDVQAGADPVSVRGGWLVPEAPRQTGRLVLGSPTMGRPDAIATNLRRLATAPGLLAAVVRIVIVDHEGGLAEVPEVTRALDSFGGAIRVVEQCNSGGSGGFSRVMHEAVDECAAGFVTLLDDDVALEPAAVLRAFEFGRRTASPSIVGSQMFDLAHPTVLDAAAERIERRTFWWCAAAPELEHVDLAAVDYARVPAVHVRHDADYAGWWGCQVPIETVRRIGYAMPFFLKWDDVEFGLRAARAGTRTVSLPGFAVWHESWRTKDDSRSWQAFFHARNRLVTALLHGDERTAADLVRASLQLDVKQLLAMQYFAVRRRHDAIRAVFLGPDAIRSTSIEQGAGLRALAAEAPDLVRHHPSSVPSGADAAVSSSAPESAPTGRRLMVWALRTAARHWLQPSGGEAAAPEVRLSEARGGWWVVPGFDSALAPTADGEAYLWYRRDRAEFRRALVEAVLLHRRLRQAWPDLVREYRAAAGLAAPDAWLTDFAPESAAEAPGTTR